MYPKIMTKKGPLDSDGYPLSQEWVMCIQRQACAYFVFRLQMHVMVHGRSAVADLNKDTKMIDISSICQVRKV